MGKAQGAKGEVDPGREEKSVCRSKLCFLISAETLQQAAVLREDERTQRREAREGEVPRSAARAEPGKEEVSNRGVSPRAALRGIFSLPSASLFLCSRAAALPRASALIKKTQFEAAHTLPLLYSSPHFFALPFEKLKVQFTLLTGENHERKIQRHPIR